MLLNGCDQLLISALFSEHLHYEMSHLSGSSYFSSDSTNRCCACCSRAFLKHSAEVVYYLDGKNVSVVLQGKTWLLSCVIGPSLISLASHLWNCSVDERIWLWGPSCFWWTSFCSSVFQILKPLISIGLQKKKTETWAVPFPPWCSWCWTLIIAAWLGFRVWCRRSGWWPAIASWTDATT